MATKEEILDYATNTPENTNRNVLNSMLENCGGGSGGFFMVSIVPDSNPATLTASYNDIKAAYDAGKVVVLKSEGINDGFTWYAENLIDVVSSGELEGVFTYMVRSGNARFSATSPNAPLSIPGEDPNY